ncbi:hypothetical protein K438DRAFT_1762252 [Mycena galopus ATCC 62051]|nr:hypothetical protein K438DRAFT_1762252 [Mycena galopus ATCC 62051]
MMPKVKTKAKRGDKDAYGAGKASGGKAKEEDGGKGRKRAKMDSTIALPEARQLPVTALATFSSNAASTHTRPHDAMSSQLHTFSINGASTHPRPHDATQSLPPVVHQFTSNAAGSLLTLPKLSLLFLKDEAGEQKWQNDAPVQREPGIVNLAYGARKMRGGKREVCLYLAWPVAAKLDVPLTERVIRIKSRLRLFGVPVALPIASIVAIPTPECTAASIPRRRFPIPYIKQLKVLQGTW